MPANHNLPNRPDAPIPGRQMMDRHPGRNEDRRDMRDPRMTELVRERTRDRGGREFPPGDRRSLDTPPRDFRNNDRVPNNEHDRPRSDSNPRWAAELVRDGPNRAPSNGYRTPDNGGRSSRDTAIPLSKAVTSDRGPAINPERLALVNPERQELINPERAALISGGNEPSRSNSPLRLRDDARDRSSRQNSPPPRRQDSEKDHQHPRRDDRSNRNNLSDPHNVPRGRPDEIAPPPAGPRGERPADIVPERALPQEKLRDSSSFQQSQPPPRPVDPDHGRLNRQVDPNFGRLNQQPDIPSGPRDRNRGNNRMTNAPQGRRDGRLANASPADIPRPPSPDKQPPTGPSGGRNTRRSGPGQNEPTGPSHAALPTPPVVSAPTSGVHPDRLKHLGPRVTQPPVQTPPVATVAPGGMHPDRVRGFGGPAAVANIPQPYQDNSRSRPAAPPLQTQVAPLGPKYQAQNSPVSRMNGAPTGPASSNERAPRGGRPPNLINNINRMLEETKHSQGQERRGRRQGGQPQTPISGPPTPILPPPPPPGPPPAQARDSGRDLIDPARADLIGVPQLGNDDRGRGDRGERGSRNDRSGRSRRTSPSDRNRDQKRSGPVEDERPSRGEHRSRGGDGESRGSDRHSRGDPSAGRDLLAGGAGGGGGARGEREHHGRDSRRDGNGDRDSQREQHQHGHDGNMGGGQGNWPTQQDNRGGERGDRRNQRLDRLDRSDRDGRGMREDGSSGRKRRSDGEGMREGSHDKRPRR